MADKWTPETPWFGGDKKTQAVWPTYVCRNPNCKSVGKSHPNCKCGAPSFSQQSKNLEYSEGGEVHFCSAGKQHEEGCEYYAEGGGVDRLGEKFGDLYDIPKAAPLDDGSGDQPSDTIGHVAAIHGLNSMLDNVIGSASLKDTTRHAKTIDDVKNQYQHRLNGDPADGMIEQGPKKSAGTEIGNNFFDGDHAAASDMVHGSPLVGDTAKTHLEPIMKRLARPILENETNPEALRSAVDYFDMSVRGNKKADSEMGSLFEPHKIPTHLQESSRESSRDDLKEKLKSIEANPEQLLGVGGNLGHYLPEHAGHLGATIATAHNYLKTLQPAVLQSAPMDEPSKPDPIAEDMYNRQLDIANHPLSVLEHIKSGTLQSQDLVTLKTIYPGLHKSLVSKIGDEFIKAKSKNIDIPYKQKVSLSLALGSPLDSTMTQPAMQAIITASITQKQSSPGKKPGATAQTQKTMEKTDRQYETPLEERQIDKKD